MENNKSLEKTSNNQLRERGNSFDPFFDDFFRFPSFGGEFKNFEKMLRADIEERDDFYIIEMELPGIKKSDINIELRDGYLTVQAEQKSAPKEKEKNYIRRERFYGSATRSFYVGDVSESEISASLDSGVLKIQIPKHQENKNIKKIEIK